MKRALPTLAATAAGIGLVLNFHSKPVASITTDSIESTVETTSQFARTIPTGGPLTLPPTSSTTTNPLATTTTTKKATTTTVAASATKTGNATTLTGTAVSTKYGPVQIAVTFENKKITEIKALQTPTKDNKSVRINNGAIPTLRSEVLTAQSAQIANVSGATITTNAYKKSLQSLIDQARTSGVFS